MKPYLSSDAANSGGKKDESVVFCHCDCLCAVMTWKPELKEQRSAVLTTSPSWTREFANTGQGTAPPGASVSPCVKFE